MSIPNITNQFEIFPIGTGYNKKISLEQKYIGGLKHLSLFSHAIIIYSDRVSINNIFNTHLSQKVVRLLEVNETTGFLQIDSLGIHIDKFVIYDIKPYFPCVDRVKDCIMPKLGSFIKAETINGSSNLSQLGTIKKINGEFYLEINNNWLECIQYFQGYSHIKIFWWFHKFDKSIYRRTLECQPPYENSPRIGVFASRSPVRPNPIALTIAKILHIDEKQGRIKVSELDCFDNTPFIGIAPYDPITDRITDCYLPKWLQHWPEWMEDKEFNTLEGNIKFKKSAIENIGKYVRSDEETKKENGLFEVDRDISVVSQEGIVIKGARQNNLKNIDVTIPYRKITVITGVSGSGKSSLAFDTIYAESQHRFMESMSLTERSQIKQLEKPKYDQITGLPPAIAISQRNVSRNPRSTVGTMTDIFDFLRSLFVGIGIRHCPECGNAIVPLTAEEIVGLLKKCIPETRIGIIPYGKDQIVYNFIIPETDNESRQGWTDLKSNIGKALEQGKGAINVVVNETETLRFQTTQMCYDCDHIFFELKPSDFSYNNPESMCPVCKGLGMTMKIDPDRIVSKPQLSVLDGASPFWGSLRKFREAPNANWMKGEFLALASDMGINLEIPWNDLPDDFKKCALYGTDTREVTFSYENKKNGRNGNITRAVEGAYHIIDRLFKSSTGDTAKKIAECYMSGKPCDCCNGERLSKGSRMVSVADTRYPEAVIMSIEELIKWVEKLPVKLNKTELDMVLPILQELHKRLSSYIQAGLSYLTLDRSAPTLSGGELQRLRLVSQLSSGITNILYILDEPSTGLHPKDHGRLLTVIQKLKDLGNTVIIVEHDADTMLAADNIIDIGIGAGESGGYIVAQGTPEQIIENDKSETGKYLSGKKQIGLSNNIDSKSMKEWVNIAGVRGNNLKNINITFPTCSVTCITGVSGSGKSSLIANGIFPAIEDHLKDTQNPCRNYGTISGADKFEKIVSITQKPIGRSTRSNPATYTGIMDEVRNIFSQTKEAKEKGFKASRFSFNSKEGQCTVCKGEGKKSLNLQFMSDVFTQCPICKGKRYNPETLEIKYKGKHIFDVLEMSVEQAKSIFQDKDKLHSILKTLEDIGLGYLKLGQSSLTLSGGEAQRIKLATELTLSDIGKTLYILDEPTTGLHFEDIQNLFIMLRKIINNGNTVILVEHNMDLIKNADWVIDLGLEGGVNGGFVVAQGTPADIMKSENSYTGEFLRK